MTPLQKQIIQIVKDASNGFLTISTATAQQIIDAVKADNARYGTVHFHKFNPSKKGWEKVRSFFVDDDVIKETLIQMKNLPPVEDCYKYDCAFSSGENAGSVYTLSSALFQ